MQFVNPATWPRPNGYSNGVIAEGRWLAIAGQVGWDEHFKIVSPDFAEQTAQALRNVVAVLSEAGGAPEHIVRMTWYVTDKNAYLAAADRIGKAYREIVGPHYPAMTLVQVVALLEDAAHVEVEVTAVLPG